VENSTRAIKRRVHAFLKNCHQSQFQRFFGAKKQGKKKIKKCK